MHQCELCQQSGDVIFSTREWRVIVVDDAHYPGFCRVIWHEHIQEMTDLTLIQRTDFMNAVWHVEAVIRDVLKPHKINLASFGNMVPHLHWHVIPRFTDDIHFPNPIWGQVERSVNLAIMERQARLPVLQSTLKQRLTAAFSQSRSLQLNPTEPE